MTIRPGCGTRGAQQGGGQGTPPANGALNLYQLWDVSVHYMKIRAAGSGEKEHGITPSQVCGRI